MEQVSVKLCIQVHKKAWFPLYNEINHLFRYGVLDQVDVALAHSFLTGLVV